MKNKRIALFILILLVMLLASCKKESTAYPPPVTPVYRTQEYPEPKGISGEELTWTPRVTETSSSGIVPRITATPVPKEEGNYYLPLIFGEDALYPKSRYITLKPDGTPYLSDWGMINQCKNEAYRCIGIPEFQEKTFYPPSEEHNIRFVMAHSEYWGVGNVYYLYPWEGCIQAEGGHVCVTSNGSLYSGTATEVTVTSQEGSPLIMLIDICYGLKGEGNWDKSPCNENWIDK